MNKKISIALGVLELSHVIYYIQLVITNFQSFLNTIRNGTALPISFLLEPIIQSLVIVSIIVSGILYIFNKKAAYIMYFPQLIFRIYYAMFSFSLIVKLSALTQDNDLYEFLMIFCVILEAIRVFVTIKCLVNSRKKVETKKSLS